VTLKVADVRANLNENIRHAARIIGRSKARREVFASIYRGKKNVKTVEDLQKATGLSQVRVLQEAGKLAGNGIVEKVKVNGRTAYKKDETYSHHKKKVLDLVAHPEKKERYPTKQEPRGAGATTYRISISRSQPLPQEITIDDVEAFARVKAISHGASSKAVRLPDIPESRIKRFLKRVVGETYEFTDWGGEKNDLYTNKLRFRGARRTAAFAIKGRATRGPLTPRKMGKNGDQIGRLFASEAQLFFVVYHSKVDQAIHEQARAYAIGRALAGNRVYYCVIDGDDLARLVEAYPGEFASAAKT
jgi:hypothetical protein